MENIRRGVVPAVKRFRDLPLMATTAVDFVGMTVTENNSEPPTLLLAIKGMIDNWRAGVSPWAPDVDLGEMIGYCDCPEGPAILVFQDEKPDDEGQKVGWWLVYGNQADIPQSSGWAPMLSLGGEVIGHIVKLLGPIEDPAE